MADPNNPPPRMVVGLSAPRYEYEVLKAKARTNGENIVTGVTGIEDTTITRMAREGWRLVSSSWSGRKLLAVILERPVARKASKGKKKPKKDKPTPLGTTSETSAPAGNY